MERNELAMYLLQVIAIHGVFFLLYHFLLRSKTTYLMNRVYLLVTLITSFVIPLIELPVSANSIPVVIDENYVFNWEKEDSPSSAVIAVEDQIATPLPQKIDYWRIVKWAYVLLAVALILRSLFHLIILQKLKKESLYVEKKWFKLFKTVQTHPFSFLANVFIPDRIFGTDSFDQILEHECEHVRQRHSIDRLLVDFVAALFWFNPFMYLYRRALIEIHEYQADAAVIRKFPDPIGYQEVLFSQLKATPYSGLVSHFNFSTIKKRIVMINKQKNRKSIWAYLLAAPVTFFVIVAFASKTVDDPNVSSNTKLETVEAAEPDMIESPVLASQPVKPEVKHKSAIVTPLLQNDYEPSILPLKETSKMKVTSGFGMRVDPFDNEKKMHKGLDLGTPIGTTVIATAKGIVHQAGYHDKYGYYILVEHEDKFMTRYSQLSELKVKKGDKVTKSQEIGLSGNSGRSTGPHLHYEVVEVGVGHKNPKDYIENHQFTTAALIFKPSNEQDEQVKVKALADQETAQALRVLAEEARHDKMLENNNHVIQRQVAELAAIAAVRERELAEMQVISIEKERELAEVRAVEAIRREEQPFLDIKNITEDPLFILDGEIVDERETRQLVPEEIEHVEVMKGDGAIKKYGSKAEGGVVIIETKKNKSPKPKQKNKEKSNKKNNQDGLSKSNAGTFRVIIDPEHGGYDNGDISPSGTLEKDVTLAIANQISSKFENSKSIEIILTREKDISLDDVDRLLKINTAGADLAITLGSGNYSEKNESLVLAAYNDQSENSEESKRTAHLLSYEFRKCGEVAKVGITSGYYLLDKAPCPSVGLIVGFFSKSDVDEYLSSSSGQSEVADRISNAIKLAAL